MNKKPKPCKLCESKRYANLSICYKHYREREKKKKDEKIKLKLERKQKTKKYQKSEYKKWHEKTWKLMSKQVRSEGADFAGYNSCYTCGQKLQWKELHAGHYRHGTLDFDKRNLKPQCNRCNTYLGGMGTEYTLHLIEDYGVEWVKKLVEDASKHPGYTVEEMKIIYNDLKNNNQITKHI